jgi:hypothetical protein
MRSNGTSWKGEPKFHAFAKSGPILSIVLPWFGQTGLECGAGQNFVDLVAGNPPAAPMRVALD